MFSKQPSTWPWWCTEVILALEDLRQEDYCELKASLGYIERSCLKENNSNMVSWFISRKGL